MNIIPRVSVVMPVYNGEKYLREAIDSILTQTYRDFEFIIVNDGSTDASEAIILSYHDDRIVYLKNEKNSGICVTLNKGLAAARGKYIARMDCDDISLPMRLETQYQYMESHKKIALIGSDFIIFGDGEERLRELPHNPAFCKMGLLFNSFTAHPSVMMRRSVLVNYNLSYKNEYRGLEDFELWWQVAKVAELSNINKPLLRYRIHPQQVTQKVDERQRQQSLTFIVERFADIGCQLSNAQTDVLDHYCHGEFEWFDTEKVNILITICRQVLNTFPIQNYREKHALKKTLSLALLYTINNAGLRYHQRLYVHQIYKKGIMPLSMYLHLKLLLLKKHDD